LTSNNDPKFEKAEELYRILPGQTCDRNQKEHILHQLDCIQDSQGKYIEALQYYEKSLEIMKKKLFLQIIQILKM